MNSLDEQIEKRHGYVALVDVLGFSDLIARDTSADELTRYMKCVQHATQAKGQGKPVRYVLFSDTIVLTTTDADDDSFIALLRSCSHLLHLLLATEIPVRGSISCGTFFRSQGDSTGVFVAGKPIVEAYRCEKSQNWIGIMLARSAISKHPELKRRCSLQWPDAQPPNNEELAWKLFLQPATQIPFHRNDPDDPRKFEGFAVVPSIGFGAMQSNIVESIDESVGHLEGLKSLAHNPKEQDKYKESIRWLTEVRNQWPAPKS